MKETLTLLERCQRDAREMQKQSYDGDLTDKEINELIVFTLKQAAEVLEGKKKEEPPHAGYTAVEAGMYSYAKGYNKALTDAQRLLLGEDND